MCAKIDVIDKVTHRDLITRCEADIDEIDCNASGSHVVGVVHGHGDRIIHQSLLPHL